ncbi:hypothetical protein D3C80_1676060 [compost metagenome]
MLSGGFIDLGTVTCELVPETVEVNTLAAGHQTLGVGAAKVEVPEHWRANNVVPRWYTRHRRVHHHQLIGQLRIARGVGKGDHGAYVVANDHRVLDAQRRQHPTNVARLGFLVVASLRNRR